MASKLSGSVIINAPRTRVWELLFQVDSLRGMLAQVPGVTIERFEEVAHGHYEVTVVVVNPMLSSKYALTIRVTDEKPLESAKLAVEGNGELGSITGDLWIGLTEVQTTKTRLSYEGAAGIQGPFASLGQRVIDSAGQQVLASGMSALGRDLERRTKLAK